MLAMIISRVFPIQYHLIETQHVSSSSPLVVRLKQAKRSQENENKVSREINMAGVISAKLTATQYDIVDSLSHSDLRATSHVLYVDVISLAYPGKREARASALPAGGSAFFM